jgi:hypothetical protein
MLYVDEMFIQSGEIFHGQSVWGNFVWKYQMGNWSLSRFANIIYSRFQVLGLICLTLKTISTESHQQTYTELISESYKLIGTPETDFDFYR